MTYEGLVPKITKSMLQKDRDALQPHIRAFVDRAVNFRACPECGGTRLNEGGPVVEDRRGEHRGCCGDADHRSRGVAAHGR